MSSPIVYLVPNLEPLALSQGSTDVYEKEVIYVGKFAKDDLKFEVTPAALEHWRNNSALMLSRGVEIPWPVEHVANAEEVSKADTVAVSIKRDKQNRLALYYHLKPKTDEAKALALSSQCSIYSEPSYVDKLGNKYEHAITHIAFTNSPVIPGLENFKTKPLAASLVPNVEKKPMLATLAKAIGFTDEDIKDKSDDDLAKMIGDKYNAMATELAEANKPPEEKKDKPAPDVAASFVTMLGDNRTNKIRSLQAQGKISKPQADALVKEHCEPKVLALALSSKSKVDMFDTILKVLDTNQPIASMIGKTGPQAGLLQLSKGEQEPEESAPVRSAKRMVAAANKR
jgi:hypothetical protein